MRHLISISIGPVQEFIAAARRTRDLWFGSEMLSEVSRAVAECVQKHGGELIFPADLSASNIANVILAELNGHDPAKVAGLAKEAAKAKWKQFTQEAWNESHRCIRKSPDVWNEQIDDVIEFFTAWVERTQDYSADRARCARLLAGRKNCRDFEAAKGHPLIPKSSLDGQRESVLLKDLEKKSHLKRRLRVRKGEQLDAIGLTKRLAGGDQPYPSVSRVAADPWIRRLNESPKYKERFAELRSICEALHKSEILRKVPTTKFSQYEDFPFEGTPVYRDRHEELLEETDAEKEELIPLSQILAKLPMPSPYLSILVADGDKMGQTIASLKSKEQHREFSSKLASFSAGAKDLVESCQGVLVYAGGDDVLAFVPVDHSLKCAYDLHESFAKALSAYQTPTLSVGIAIGHFLENLEDLLEFGRQAEKAAKKPDRNGLAIHLHKRGGSPVYFRQSWSHRPDEYLHHLAELFCKEAIPGKLAYDLRKIANDYKNWKTLNYKEPIVKDVIRLIKDKQPKSGKNFMPEIENIVKNQVSNAEDLLRFSETLLIAKVFSDSMKSYGTKSSGSTIQGVI